MSIETTDSGDSTQKIGTWFPGAVMPGATIGSMPSTFGFTHLLTIALAVVLATSTPRALAGRPMVVDDAGIVGAKSCQLESWLQDNRGTVETWVLPACNFTGNLEVAFGGARITGGQTTQTIALLQGKTLFKTLEMNGWGAGLVFGNQFNVDSSVIGDLFATVPVSFSLQDDRFLVHTNFGWVRERATGRQRMTWGVGAEAKLSERAGMTSEAFRQADGKSFFQVGVKHWLQVDRIQIDASYGHRLGRGNTENYISVGMVLFTNTLR